jgi:hypothetical protein
MISLHPDKSKERKGKERKGKDVCMLKFPAAGTTLSLSFSLFL